MQPASDIELVDFRRPEHRRAVFHDFYEFHLRWRSHPGCVYYLMPYLRDRYGWDDEEALWFAFLNGNTQNPITSLLLHRRCPSPDGPLDAMLTWFRDNYALLQFDTDRRYHKKSLPAAVSSYLHAVRGQGGTQARFWRAHAQNGFPAVWDASRSIATFGRLSAFSYAEYLWIMGVDFDCTTLFLDDLPGSRSHRNGLCIVTALDHLDWHSSNPGFPGYNRDAISYLEVEGAALLDEARARAAGQPWERDVSYFTLESTLCTYKGWHRVNRRYPSVYNDMLHDRIAAAERAFPEEDLAVFWDAREASLPPYLRQESMGGCDPGLDATKQNHYRLTGEVVVMGRDPLYADRYWSAFDENVYGCWQP